MSKRAAFNLLKYLLAFGLLGYVIWAYWNPPGGNGLGDLWQRHVVEGQPIHAWFLVGALAVYTVALFITLFRWYILVRAQDLPFRLGDAIRIGLIGFFYNTFLPGSVGGDIVKAAALAREQSRRTVAVATVLMDRLIALWGLVWYVAVLGSVFWLGGLLDGEGAAPSRTVVFAALVIVAVTAIGWLLLGLLPQHRADRFAGRLSRLPKVGGSAAEFWRAVWMYRCRQKSVIVAMGISFVSFTGFILAFYWCVRSVWDPAPGMTLPTLAEHFLIVPMGLVIMAIPGAPGGIGIGEAGFGGLYLWFGYKATSAYAILGTLVQRVVVWSLALVCYLACLLFGRSRPAGQRTPTPIQAPAEPAHVAATTWQPAPAASTN